MVCPGSVKTAITLNSLTGEGTPYGQTDQEIERGITAESCVVSLPNGVQARRLENNLSPPESYAVTAHRLFPTMIKRLISKRINWCTDANRYVS